MKLFKHLIIITVFIFSLFWLTGINAQENIPVDTFTPTPNIDPFAKIIEINPTSNKKTKTLTDDEILDKSREFNNLIKYKRFEEALNIIESLPEKNLTKTQKDSKKKLLFYKTLEQEATEGANALLGKEDELDDTTQQTIKRLYREAQTAYIDGQDDIVKDVLIHILFLHRRNTKAKKFLENAYELKVGTYTVENEEEKYWKRSDTAFYGGNYEQCVQALNILTFFDRENPLVYQRLGSAYYMMAERQKAIDAWKTALFLSGGKNKDLEKIIEQAQKLIIEDTNQAKERNAARKKREEKTVQNTSNMRLMRVCNTKEQAYSYAEDLKKENINALVEEMENGKFAVKAPK